MVKLPEVAVVTVIVTELEVVELYVAVITCEPTANDVTVNVATD